MVDLAGVRNDVDVAAVVLERVRHRDDARELWMHNKGGWDNAKQTERTPHLLVAIGSIRGGGHNGHANQRDEQGEDAHLLAQATMLSSEQKAGMCSNHKPVGSARASNRCQNVFASHADTQAQPGRTPIHEIRTRQRQRAPMQPADCMFQCNNNATVKRTTAAFFV